MTRAAGRANGRSVVTPAELGESVIPAPVTAPAASSSESAAPRRLFRLPARVPRGGTAPVAPAALAASAATRRLAAPPRPSRSAGSANRARKATVNPEDQPMWGRMGLFVLLGLVVILQMIIGLASHLLSSRQRPILIDIFYFNTLLVLPGCVLLMPLAKRLTHQPRTLRFMESLSFGAVYAIFALLLTAAFLPAAPKGQTNANIFIDSLRTSDVPGLALGDLLALLAAVQIYPGLNRLLSAPGRRARKRLLARQESGAAPRGARESKPRPPRRGA